MPGERNIGHAQASHQFALIRPRASQVHDDIDAELAKVAKAFRARLSASIECGRHLAELRNAFQGQSGGGLMLSVQPFQVGHGGEAWAAENWAAEKIDPAARMDASNAVTVFWDRLEPRRDFLVE